MEEIAPEYDVIVLGTGIATPPSLSPNANTRQALQNAFSQGTRRLVDGSTQPNNLVEFSV